MALKMSGSAVDRAAKIGGAIAAADATALTGVYRYAASASNTAVALPARTDKRGGQATIAARFLRIRAVGCNAQYAEGFGAAPTLVFNQLSAWGTGHVAAGGTVVDGTSEDFVVDNRTTHLAWICSNATGFVEFYLSDAPGAA